MNITSACSEVPKLSVIGLNWIDPVKFAAFYQANIKMTIKLSPQVAYLEMLAIFSLKYYILNHYVGHKIHIDIINYQQKLLSNLSQELN